MSKSKKVFFSKWIPTQYVDKEQTYRVLGTGVYSERVHEGILHKWVVVDNRVKGIVEDIITGLIEIVPYTEVEFVHKN